MGRRFEEALPPLFASVNSFCWGCRGWAYESMRSGPPGFFFFHVNVDILSDFFSFTSGHA